MDLSDIIHQLVATPGSALRRELLGEEAEWGPHEENTARLLDVEAYQLDWEWARKTTDPEDPSVRREQLDARRRGIRPPRRPLIPPVAARPPGLAEQKLAEYLARVAEHAEPAPNRRAVTLAEFNQVIGAM